MIGVRFGILALAILTACAGSSDGPTGAQQLSSFEHLDECPNPILESMSWELVQGVLVEVSGARTVRVRTDAGHLLNVVIADVADRTNPAAEAILRSWVGKRVSVLGNNHGDVIVAEVQDARTGKDLARELLRTGSTSFEAAKPYTLSDYSECLNRIAEREAKADRLGIWR